jgi:hypothetical protein
MNWPKIVIIVVSPLPAMDTKSGAARQLKKVEKDKDLN